MPIEAVRPLNQMYGTSLASRISGYERLKERITWSLGYPMVNVELHTNQIYENISIAVEMFTKFAGYTKEYLVFDTKYYTENKGVRLDKLYNLTPGLSGIYDSANLSLVTTNPISETTTVSADGTAQVVYSFNCSDTTTDPSEFNIRIIDDTTQGQDVRQVILVVDHDSSAGTTDASISEINSVSTKLDDDLNMVFFGTIGGSLSGSNEEIVQLTVTPTSEVASTATVIVVPTDSVDQTTDTSLVSSIAFGGYDAILNQYRKVIDVTDFNEGSTTGVNTLFTIEQTLAQQTYFSYAMGQYGFDLVSWYTVKEWLDLREKLLTIKHSYQFNPNTQLLRLFPEPTVRTYGIVSAYVEKPIEFVIYEPWIYQYALALCKVSLGRVRGKYGGTALFGGGQLDTGVLSEGLQEKEKLEQELYEGGSTGLGDAGASMFFIG